MRYARAAMSDDVSAIDPALPPLRWLRTPLAAPEVELQWLDAAVRGTASAVLWSQRRGLVAPLSYRRHDRLDAVCAAFAARGVPVRLRRSGGGVVPQGPGILNLSLAYPLQGDAGIRADAVYRHLCAAIARAFSDFGVDAQAQPVAGSFCDGRYNLAVAGRKICGTAQYWRRAGTAHAVLAHAIVLVDADARAITVEANAFEDALGSGRRYDPAAIVTLHEAAGAPEGPLAPRLAAALAGALGVPLETAG